MSDQNQYVTDINPYDVLFGRGSGPNDHEGNIRFRDMVSQRKEEYMATNHRQTKATIAKTIVDTVLANNGRFLKKLEPAELEKLGLSSSTAMDVYQVVDEDAIMEKAKQALRQNREKASGGAADSLSIDATVAATGMLPQRANNLPQVFVHGNQGQFGMPDSMTSAAAAAAITGMMNDPVPVFSVGDQPGYREDERGYATYTTTLDDPEDDRLFDGPINRNHAPGQRRGLGGRKGEGPRRDSMQMADVWKKGAAAIQSMDMSELMESFKGMSTTGELNSSSDTIGTIEGDVYRNSQMSGISNMSAMSMASTTSLFKTNSSDNIPSSSSGAVGSEDTFATYDNNGRMRHNMSGGMNHRGSLIPREAWNSGQLQNLLQAPIDGSSTMLALDHSGGQRPVQLMEHSQPDSMGFLGASSMSLLRGVADQSSSSFRTDNLSNSDPRVLPPERK